MTLSHRFAGGLQDGAKCPAARSVADESVLVADLGIIVIDIGQAARAVCRQHCREFYFERHKSSGIRASSQQANGQRRCAVRQSSDV